MFKNQVRKQLKIIVVFVLFISCLFVAYMENTSFLTIQTSYVTINDGNFQIQGLLYKPNSVSSTNPAPGIVLAHGIANSKEVTSGFALELAKRGFVTLAIDEAGHGNSGGNWALVEKSDPSLGVISAANWMKEQSFVNPNAIGLIGHSMGAGSVLSAALNLTFIKSTVLIGGGINGTLTSSSNMTATRPNNLLVIIGQFDVLFNVHQVENSDLKQVFNTTSPIQENKLYGSFSDLTARKFITVPATHLFEIISPASIAIINNWMVHSLNFTPTNMSPNYTSSLIRDAFIIFAFAFFICTILFLSKIFITKFKDKQVPLEDVETQPGKFLLVGLSWGIMSLLLFLPSEIVGSIIIFPPMIFGSFFAFWHLFTVIGAIILLYVFQKYHVLKFKLKTYLKSIYENRTLVYFGVGIFLVMYGITVLCEELLQLNFKIFIPVLNEIGSPSRVVLFFIMLPYTLLFFFFQNVYFYHLSDYKDFKSLKTLGIQIALIEGPFIIVLAIFYLPILLFSTVLIHGTTGFFTEFLVPTTGVFIITTCINWYYYKETENITIGTILNALLVALVIASLFPVVQTFF